jgi:hypothetical protein
MTHTTIVQPGVAARRGVSQRRREQRGFTLLTAAVSMLVLIGMVGLAVDIGRMYIAKSEAQVFADSASLAATIELDGTQAGIARARARVASNPNKWNFETSTYTNVTTAFATSTEGPWEEYPLIASNVRYARAITTVQVPIYFLSLFTAGKLNVTPSPSGFIAISPNSFTAGVRGDSEAGQELQETFREGIFPFSPYAHNNVGPHFGLSIGQEYTFRWGAHAVLNNNVCAGDNDVSTISLSEAGGGSERGYIEETSAAIIRAAIVEDYQTTWRGIGDTVNMTGGAKQTELDAVQERIRQDGNWWSETYQDYVASGLGNGRRVVAMPINSGYPDYIVRQIGAFFLHRADDYHQGGNREWCATYLGPWVQGAKTKGAMDGSGAYVVRLVK